MGLPLLLGMLVGTVGSHPFGLGFSVGSLVTWALANAFVGYLESPQPGELEARRLV
jgi:hypothetical protein